MKTFIKLALFTVVTTYGLLALTDSAIAEVKEAKTKYHQQIKEQVKA